MTSTRATSRWSLSHAGNRVMWALIAAFLTWLVFHGAVLPIAVGLVAFAILTAVNSSRR